MTEQTLSRAARHVCDHIFGLLAYELQYLRYERVIELYGQAAENDGSARGRCIEERAMCAIDSALETELTRMQRIGNMRDIDLDSEARDTRGVCEDHVSRWPMMIRQALEVAMHVRVLRSRMLAYMPIGSSSKEFGVIAAANKARENMEKALAAHFDLMLGSVDITNALLPTMRKLTSMFEPMAQIVRTMDAHECPAERRIVAMRAAEIAQIKNEPSGRGFAASMASANVHRKECANARHDFQGVFAPCGPSCQGRPGMQGTRSDAQEPRSAENCGCGGYPGDPRPGRVCAKHGGSDA